MSLVTVADTLLNPDDSPRAGIITFVPTRRASNGSGIVAASSSVSATLNGSGAFSVNLTPNEEYDSTVYYQAYFKPTTGPREFLGLYDFPVSDDDQTLDANIVTAVDANVFYKFASETSVQRLVNAVYDESLAAVQYRVQAYGGVADGVQATGSGSSGSATFTASTSVFVASDVGKKIYIVLNDGTLFRGEISAYTSATVVTLDDTLPAAATAKAFYFGTDNTEAFADMIAALAAIGGGIATGESGNYIVDEIELEKKIKFIGTGIDCFQIWSAKASGSIVTSSWPIDSSTAVDIDVEQMTIRALDPMNATAGFADTGGTFVNVRQVRCQGTTWDFVSNQTEVSSYEKCRFEGLNVTRYGALVGSSDPTGDYGDSSSQALAWTLTGSPAGAVSDGTRWALSVSSAEVYYSRAFPAGSLRRGATVTFRGCEVVSGSQTLRVCDGTSRFDLVFTGSTVALNGGTGRTLLQGQYAQLKVARGGATAELWVNGTKTDDDIAALAATTVNSCVAWGQIGSGTSSVYWNDFHYQNENPVPAGLWLVSGDDWTEGADGEFTNVITVKDCQFNRVAIGIAADGGYAHFIENNNFNGTLHDLAIASAFAVEFSKNACESSLWEPIRVGGPFLQRSVAVGSPTAINIMGGQMHHGKQFGACAIDARATVSLKVDKVNFPAGASKPVAIRFTAGSVNDLRLGTNPTGGCDLLTGIPSASSTRLMAEAVDVSNPEAHVYRQSSYRFRTIANALTVGSDATLDLSLGSDWIITLNASATITITNIDKVSDVKLKIIQGTGGSRVPTFSPAPKWNGSAPTWATTTGHYDFVELWSDGTNLIEKGRNLDLS